MPSVELSEKDIALLVERYKDYIVEPKNEYIETLIKLKDATITIYKSKKVVFQGKDLSDFSNYFLLKDDEKSFNYDLYNTIGADEVGTGDVFGPIICASCFIEKKYVEELKKLGVNDSKKISDEKIKEIAPILISKYPHKVIMLKNEDFNDKQHLYNMNAMKAILHNANLNNLSKIVNYDYAVLDQFVEKDTYYTYINSNPFTNLKFEVKGESKSVACASASIIARYYFLMEMERLSKTYGYDFPKGSGTQADEVILKIKNDNKEDIFYHTAKMSFNNFKK